MLASSSILDAQPLHRYSADQVALDDLLHVLDGDAAVPDLLGVDHDGDAAGALVEAARGVGADALLEAALVQQLLEFVAHGVGAFFGAAALRVAGLAAVGADEDVTVEV